MQVKFGSHTYEALAYPRENGDMLVVNFIPSDTSFEDMKTLLHNPKNTKVITFVDEGEHEIEYTNYSVYRELGYKDSEEDDNVIVAFATLKIEDLATKIERVMESVEETNAAIDEILTIVIPELLFGDLVDDEE